MLVKQIGEKFLIRLEAEDEVIASLQSFAETHWVDFASFQAIGALRGATLGFFNATDNSYQYWAVEEHVEVLSLIGNISRGEDDAPVVHAHIVLGRADGQALGGHLVSAVVYPTLEVVLSMLPERIQRRKDPLSGLVLWDLA